VRRTKVSLSTAVAALEAHYGKQPRLETDPWKAVVWENVAYLVDDERRRATYEALRARVGLTPGNILRVPRAKLARVIVAGGMKPEHRAEKLRHAAEIASEVGVAQLRAMIKADPQRARRVLKRFPGIGEPGADRLLMLRGAALTLAPESNGLRVLIRLGWGKEDQDYGRTYRAVVLATEAHLQDDKPWLARAHGLLRHHGKSLCLRSRPLCIECPLQASCPASIVNARE
jgi:endonuclease III